MAAAASRSGPAGFAGVGTETMIAEARDAPRPSAHGCRCEPVRPLTCLTGRDV